MIPEVVYTLRNRQGISGRALSKKAGLSPSYVQKLEAGDIDPTVKAFSAIAEALGMSRDEILLCVMSEMPRIKDLTSLTTIP
jgi:transcriptional regulator with XRE-family HTH domain